MDIRMPRHGRHRGHPRGSSRPAAPRRVLVLTTFDLDEYVYDALRAGASGFLLKDVPPGSSSPTAIRTVAAGDALLAPSVTRRLIERVRRAGRRPRRDARAGSAELTDREARGAPAGRPPACPTPRSPTRLFVAQATVKTHVSRLLAKLGLRDRAQAVVFAYETGLVVPGAGRLTVAEVRSTAGYPGHRGAWRSWSTPMEDR